MNPVKFRALVLAAGEGTRLQPLTAFIPKPLLPIDGEPIAGHTLRQLAGAGCELAVLNLHHLPDQIRDHFGRSCHGMPVRYSLEEQIQGTLGALHGPRDLLRQAEVVLVLNGDTLCRWPLQKLIRQHLRSSADVTLLLHRRAPEAALGGGVGVGADGRIVSLRDSTPIAEVRTRHVFAGAHVLSPAMFERIQEGAGDIISGLYVPLLQEGARLQAMISRRPWHDLGTPRRYFIAAHDAAVRGLRDRWRDQRISPLARVDHGAKVTGSFVEAEAEIGEKVSVERSILLSGARLERGCRVRSCILGPGVRLPASSVVERRMINRMPAAYQPGGQESVMGDLVYTPLEP